MTFLPSTYTKIPTSSNYMKFQDGENNFRVLSSAITGFQYWNVEKKPIRSREAFRGIPADIQVDDDGGFKINHFWAFVVWNYEENKVQILEVTQKQIMKAIKALADNPKWGDPHGYDICVKRSGMGFDTEYLIQPSPHSKLEDKIAAAYADTNINLDALFEGQDPFTTQPAEQTTDLAQTTHQEVMDKIREEDIPPFN